MSGGDIIPVISVPNIKKAKVSVWKDIGVAETDHVMQLSSADETKAFLMETFGIQRDSQGRYLIVLDMFYYAVQFCKENYFDREKTSSLLSILKQTHEMAIETPFGNIRETLEFFKDLILCHTVHRPPFSLGIFSPQEASAISTYFVDSYFRHFKLYKYIFTPQVQLDVAISYTKFPKTPKSTIKSDLKDEENSKGTIQDEIYYGDLGVESTAPHAERTVDEGTSTPVENSDAFDPSSESIKELKRLIRERLGAEMQELQASVHAQLQQSDEAIGKVVAEANDPKKQAAKKKK